jgi:AcrR family transcriptional regulator
MTTTASTPKKRGRPPANRDKLLDGALACLSEKGYAATTARDLVAASGTNLASIGYHFGSKEALLNEAIARSMGAWTAAVEHEVFAGEAVTLAERLERALAAMIDRHAEIEPFLRSFVEAFPPALHDDDLRATMAAAYVRVRAAGREMVKRAAADDGVAIDPRDAEVLSSLMLAVCDGLILQWLLDPSAVPSSRDVVRALRALGDKL